MASLQPQINGINKGMYQSITPKKNRTFSENMMRRRRPFLCSENILNKSLIYQTPKTNLTQPREEENVNTPNCSDHELKSATVNLMEISETNVAIKQTGENEKSNIESMQDFFECMETAAEKFMNNSGEMSQTSGYYSEGSFNETISFSDDKTSADFAHQLEEQLPPLKNSTFIDQEKADQSETFFSLNETESDYKTSLFEQNTTNEETQINMNEAFKKNKNEGSGNSGKLTCSSQNSLIPVIIIIETKDNEVKNDLSTIPQLTETEIKGLTTFNDPTSPQRTNCNENRKLKEKLKQMKLFNQVEIKNKVMTQIKELSNLTAPKLKHNKECEKKNNGSLPTCQLKNNAKKQEGYSDLLWYMWSTIKYPFVTYTKTAVKKNFKKINSNKEKTDKTNNEKGEAKKSIMNKFKQKLSK